MHGAPVVRAEAARLFVAVAVVLTLLHIAGCASPGEADDADREPVGSEHAEPLNRMIREAQVPLSDPGPVDRVWEQYVTTRDHFREQATNDTHFPQVFYDTAWAYFAASGSLGHLLPVLRDAAEDVLQHGGPEGLTRYASYQGVRIQYLLELGSRKEALALTEDMIGFISDDSMMWSGVDLMRVWRDEPQWSSGWRSRREYVETLKAKLKQFPDAGRWRGEFSEDTDPREYLTPVLRIHYAVILRHRYAAMPVADINRERFIDDTEFILASLERDKVYRNAYKRRGIPGVYLLLPFLRLSAELDMAGLHDRIWRRMEPLMEGTARLSEADLIAADSTEEKAARALGATAGGLRNRFIAGDPGEAERERLRMRFREWAAFDVALARWEAARAMGREERRRHSYQRLVEAFDALDQLYELVGGAAAKADGFERAEYHAGLARAYEAERQGDYNLALRQYQDLVERSEAMREGLPPRLRLHFFQGLAKTAYQGVIRLEARRIRAGSGDWDPFLAAVHRFRGRQLREQAAGDQSGRAPTLAEVQSGLRRDEALLISLDLDRSWTTAVITATRARMHGVDDADQVRRAARASRHALVNGKDSSARGRLLPLVLGDTAPLVDEHYRLNAITGGLLSLVPLEALRLNGRFMVATHEIRYFPALAVSDGDTAKARRTGGQCKPVVGDAWQAARRIVEKHSDITQVADCVDPWLRQRWGGAEAGEPPREYRHKARLHCSRAIANLDRREMRDRVEKQAREWVDRRNNRNYEQSKVDVCVEAHTYYDFRHDLTEDEAADREYRFRKYCRNKLTAVPDDYDYRQPARQMYARLRRESTPGNKAGRDSADVLVVADPEYRTNSAASTDQRSRSPRRQLRANNAGGYFTPLPETRQEADAVLTAFEGRNQRLLTGAQASEPRVRSSLCRQPEVLHFATHGILSGELPGLDEAALVLAETPGEDGLLTTSEINDLHTDARLAVLSACNTGNGERISGEGLMGVSRAFLVSGTDQVVASLWPVASRATVRFMTRFYAYFNDGRSPAAALRAAKQDMRRGRLAENDRQRALKSMDIQHTDAVHAYYWSPFVLITRPGHK